MVAYVYPSLGRSGLGNCLLPWARAVVFAHQHKLPILAPSWGKFRLGPYLRRERDKRRYGHLFHYDGYVRGLRRASALMRSHAISEDEGTMWLLADRIPDGRDLLVVFEGLKNYFEPLLPHHALIREKLWNMARPRNRRLALNPPAPFFAGHVRRGDRAQHPDYTPLDWFVQTVKKIRQFEQYNHIPVLIYTDGSPTQVASLLELENVILAPADVSLVDLFRLSRASLLLASGYSTFSMWASFLGGMPTIYAPGKIQQYVQVGRRGALEIELAGCEDLPMTVFSSLQKSADVCL